MSAFYEGGVGVGGSFKGEGGGVPGMGVQD